MSYYCPRGKNVKIKTIRFLGPVRSLFTKIPAQLKKKLKKKKKTRTLFLQKSMKNFSSGENNDFNSGTKNRSDERFLVFYSP